jgi:hypothetical protein
MQRHRFSYPMLAVTCSLSGSACLPGDTRPPPGVARVTVSPTDMLLAGIPSSATEDGWGIDYDRFLIGLGRVSLEGDACSVYSDAGYTRLFDMRVPGAQKVSEQYALGACAFGFRVVPPASDSLLGAEVSEGDRLFMRSPGSNKYASGNAVSMYLEGRAVNGEQVKHFAWAFRWRVAYDDCKPVAGGESGPGLSFVGGQTQDVDIAIAGEAVFRDDPEPELGKLRFLPFAQADELFGDGDGEVTLEELDTVPLAGDAASAAYARSVAQLPPSVAARLRPEPTLADYLYVSALPSVPRFGGVGSCTVRVFSRPGGLDDDD